MPRFVILSLVSLIMLSSPLVRAAEEGTSTPAPAEEPAAAAPTPWNVVVAPAYASLDVDGNFRRFEQYVTPPNHGLLSELALHYLAPDGQSLLQATLQDIGTPGPQTHLWSAFGTGNVVLRADTRKSEFYREWTADTARARRRDGDVDLTMQTGSGEARFAAGTVNLLAPAEENPADWTSTITGARYTAHAGNWLLGGVAQREAFAFDEASLFDGNATTFGFRASPRLSDGASLDAHAALTETSLEGPTVSPRNFRAGIDYAQGLGQNFSLSGEINHGEITRTITENAYAKRDSNAEVRLNFLGIPRADLSVGGGARFVDYVNSLQTATTSAQENNVFAEARTRLSSKLKLAGSLTHWWTDDRPVAIELTGVPVGSLVWSGKDDQQLEASYALNWNAGLSARLRHLKWRNSSFDASNSMMESELFGWWMPTEKLTGYLSFLQQNYGLSGIPTAGQYVSDARSRTVGATYQLATPLQLETSFTQTGVSGSEASNQHTYVLGMNYLWPSGMQVGLRAVRDLYHTPVAEPTLDYDATWYELRLTKAIF